MICGQGIQYRTRAFKQPEIASRSNCLQMVQLREERKCYGSNDTESGGIQCPPNGQRPSIPLYGSLQRTRSLQRYPSSSDGLECKVRAWSEWSSCSKSCGEGQMSRTRQYSNPMEEDDCQVIYFSNQHNKKV